jgi:hypothetical protein
VSNAIDSFFDAAAWTAAWTKTASARHSAQVRHLVVNLWQRCCLILVTGVYTKSYIRGSYFFVFFSVTRLIGKREREEMWRGRMPPSKDAVHRRFN